MERRLPPLSLALMLASFLISCLPADGLSVSPRGRVAGPSAESESDRATNVRFVTISPGDVTLRLGLKINLIAVARDEKGNALSGVASRWTAQDSTGQSVPITSDGTFEARVPGTFHVTASAGKGKGTITVKVPVEARSTGETAGTPSSSSPHLCKLAVVAPPAEPLALPVNVGGGAGFNPAVLTPGNRRSIQPNDALNRVRIPSQNSSALRDLAIAIQTAGNSNFTFFTSAIDIPGRGLNLSLALTYNSLVWTILNSSNSNTYFDIDADWPAPGFNLTFGKLVNAGSDTAMFIDGNGDRHPFATTSASGATTFTGYTTDGTQIDYSATFDSGGNITSGQLQYPDGSAIALNAAGANAVHATQLTDRNGNYITITYSSQGAPAIAVVSDTLGRIYQFNYDVTGLLVGITGPGLGGTTRELVHFTYQALPLFQAIISGQTFGFSSPLSLVVQPYSFHFLQSIVYPSANAGYWLGDSNSYSAYGMVAKVSERVAMSLSGNTYTTQGTVINTGVVRRETTYNYPLTAQSLTVLPTYTTATDSWANMDTAPAVTTFAVTENANPRNVVVTTPDQITTVQKAYNSPGTYLDGLTYRTETHTGGPGGPLVGALDFTYSEGSRGNARLTSVKTTDEKGQTTQTSYGYAPSLNYDQVFEVISFGYSSETLRTTLTGYSTDPGYTARHIYNVPLEVDVSDSSGTLVSHTLYSYDAQRGQQLIDAAPPGSQHLSGHLDTFNPFEPVECQPPVCHQVCITENCIVTCHTECVPGPCSGYYVPPTDYRGNLSSVTSYSNAAAQSGPLTQTFQYDITGNIVTSVNSAGVVTATGYSATTNFAYPQTVAVGSGTGTVNASAVYDFGTGLETSATDSNAQTLAFSYDPNSLRLSSAQRSTGAHTDFIYSDSLFAISATTYLSNGTSSSIGSENIVIKNGLGATKTNQTLAEPQASSLFDSVSYVYDAMGRVSGQSLPFRAGGLQSSGGPFTTVTYDFAGRIISELAADGVSMSYLCYNEYACHKLETSPSTSAGQTVRREDAWGRQSWSRSDALGRLVEAVEPNPSGATGSVSDTGAFNTTYLYDGLDNLIQIAQGSQTRTFLYDSLSRLVAQTLPEKIPTLNAAGAYVGTGSYTDVFIYNQSTGNLSTQVDARGVQTIYTYETGALNRLISTTYNLSGVGDTSQVVAAAPNLTYSYVASGDLTRVETAVAAGVATETLGYDGFGRLGSVGLTLSARPSFPLETDFSFDTIDRVISVTYPMPYGFGTTRRVVSTPIGVDGRPKQVVVDGTAHAAGITYTASGGLSTATIGIAAQYQGSETYTYDATSGFLSSQFVQAKGAYLLNLSYSYTRPKIGGTSGAYRTGQLVSIANGLNASEGRTYGYDALGRLVSANGGVPTTAPQWTETYAYDRYGNRLGVTAVGNASGTGGPIPVDGLGSVSFGTDSTSNRITDLGWVYDDAGNLLRGRISAATWEQFGYDAAGRLVAVCEDGGVNSSGKLLKACTSTPGATNAALVEAYTYGVNSERLMVQNGSDASARRYYARSTGAVVMEYTESDSAPTSLQYAKSTVFFGGRLLSSAATLGSTESWQFYHSDRLGTRLIVVGGLAKEQVSLPFGTELLAESTGSTNYRFTSYDRNETTALDYAVNRFYGAAQGRFTQVDPYGDRVAMAADPQSFNNYAYARNDPLNLLDPSGLDWELNACFKIVGYTGDDGGVGGGGWVPVYDYADCGFTWYPGIGVLQNAPGTPSVGGPSVAAAAPKKSCTAVNASQPAPTTKLPQSYGPTLSFASESGNGGSGLSAQAAYSSGMFPDSPQFGNDFITYALTANLFNYQYNSPQTSHPPVIGGSYSGLGAGGWISNAQSVQNMYGPFTNISVNVGFGPVGGSVQFSYGGGTWVLAVTPFGPGHGASISKVTTNTIPAPASINSGCVDLSMK